MDRMENVRTKSYLVEDAPFRTSVTADEAVAIMLGYLDGPFVARSLTEFPSDEELEFLREAELDINDWFTGRRDSLKTEYKEAEKDDLSEAIINERREALEQGRHELVEVRRRLGEIADELEKKEKSALTIDSQLSNEHSKYITLCSLDEWAKNKGYGNCFFPLPSVGDHTLVMLAQDKAIVKALENLGHDPLNIPKSALGMPGVRSQVKKEVESLSCFSSRYAFKHAWQRLLDANKAARK